MQYPCEVWAACIRPTLLTCIGEEIVNRDKKTVILVSRFVDRFSTRKGLPSITRGPIARAHTYNTVM